MEEKQQSLTAPDIKDKNEWMPKLDMENRNPSRDAIKRIRTDLRDIIRRPFDTPYEGGFFHFLIHCPDDYPHSPPRVMLMNTCGGTYMRMVKSVCRSWEHGTVHLGSLMNERPYHNEPGFERERLPNESRDYSACIRHETLRVAVVEMIESHAMPLQLRQVILSLFPSFIETYEITCQENCHMDGEPLRDPFCRKDGAVFRYGELMRRLQAISEHILVEEGAEYGDEDNA